MLESPGGAAPALCRAGRGLEGRRPFEKERRRHVERARDLLQPASANPVRAFLVFLHLLECEPQRFAELLLAHAQNDAPHAHAAADVTINRIGTFLIFSAEMFSSLIIPTQSVSEVMNINNR